MSAHSLQSPDDLEASYCEKAGKGYRGYVANVTETYEEDNPVQLITAVQVAPNTTDDSALLVEVLPELKERTGVEVLYTDGSYGGEQVDEALQAHEVTLIQTTIRGRPPSAGRLQLRDFTFDGKRLETGRGVICPNGQTAQMNLSQRGNSYQADFKLEVCSACRLRQQYPGKEMKRKQVMRLRFMAKEWQRARRIRRSVESGGEERNQRVGVEATVRNLKHPFPAGKLPVHGRFWVVCMVIGVAAAVNMRRLHCYLRAKIAGEQAGQEAQGGQNRWQKRAGETFFSLLHLVRRFFDAFRLCYRPVFSC